MTPWQFGNLFVLRLPSEVSKDVEADASVARFRYCSPLALFLPRVCNARADTTTRTFTAARTRWTVWPRFTAERS